MCYRRAGYCGIKTLFLLGILLISQAVYAEQWYKVELIIFKRTDTPTVNNDDWREKPGLNPQSSHELQAATENEHAFNLLKRSQLDLLREAQQIQRQPHYQVLLHQGWYQAIDNPRKASGVHLFGGSAYDISSGNVSERALNIYRPQAFSAEEALEWEVDGTVTVSQSRFFTIKTNLIFTEPNSETDLISGFVDPLQHFYMQQSQKMKLNELHYFDHPKFGVLAKITRVKPPLTH